MSDPAVDPASPPAPDPVPTPDPAPPNPLEATIAKLASFDPSEFEGRLNELAEKIGNTDLIAALREAIDPAIHDLSDAVRALTELVKSGAGTPSGSGASGDPAAPPPVAPIPDPAPAPTPDPTPEPSKGLLGDLFGVPEVPTR